MSTAIHGPEAPKADEPLDYHAAEGFHEVEDTSASEQSDVRREWTLVGLGLTAFLRSS